MPEDVHRIAVWQFGGIGDMIIGAAVVRDVIKKYPDAAVDVYCSSLRNSEFIRSLGFQVAGIFEYDVYGMDCRTFLGKNTREYFYRTAESLCKQRYDLIINLHIPKLIDWWLFEILLMRRSGAQFIVGFVPSGAPKGLLDRQMEAEVVASRHYIELYQELLTPIHIDVGDRGYFPVSGLHAKSTLAVLHPGASMLFKRWPIENFIALARRLLDQGWRVAVVGDGKETALGDAMIEALPEVENQVGILGFQDMANLLAGAGLFVGNDSAPFHLAVAVNVSAVGIFGAGPRMYSDYPAANVQTVRISLSCAPCFSNVCELNMECMSELSLNQVWDAVVSLTGESSVPESADVE